MGNGEWQQPYQTPILRSTGAAQALSITKPAVTKTVNELEETLGTRLFVRGRRGATLTPEAQFDN